jgi:hypothetical protein
VILESFAIVALLAEPSPGGGTAAPAGGDTVFSVVYPKTLRDGWLELTPLFGASISSRFMPLAPGAARTTVSVPRNAGAFVLCAGGEGVATACKRRTPDDSAPFAPSLDAGGLVRGRVVTKGEPIARSRVALVFGQLVSRVPFTAPLEKDGDKLVRTVLTGADGRFVLPHVAVGEYRLEVVLPTGLLTHSQPIRVEAPRGSSSGPPSPVDVPDVDVPAGLALEVLALDDRGVGVPAVRVAIAQGDPGEGIQQFEATTDPAGRAIVSGLRPSQQVRVTCLEPNHVRDEEVFPAPPRTKVCTMPRLASISTVVLDAEDEPLGNGTLSVLVERKWMLAHAGRDGAVSLGRVPPGPHDVTVGAAEHESFAARVEFVAGEEARLAPVRLPPASPLFGVLEDQNTVTPVVGATVSVVLPTGDESSANTDDSGRFELRVPRREEIRLRVTAEGYASVVVPVPPEVGGTEASPYLLTVTRGGRIRVAVWDEESDAACAGCAVVVTGGETPRSLITDSGGNATTEPLPAGTYVVVREQARATGSIVNVSGGDDTRLARVTPGATVDVSFGEKGRWLTLEVAPAVGAGWLIATESTSRSDVIAAEADGTFRMRRPTRGAMSIFAQNGPTKVRLAVVGEESRDATLALRLPNTLVQGEIVPGQPTGMIRIVTDVVVAQTSPDAMGRFVVPFLPAGSYTAFFPGGRIRVFALRDPATLDLGMVK